MNRVVVVAAVLMLAFAGCTGFVGDSDTDAPEEPSATSTPTSTPTSPPTSTPAEGHPPGVTDDGLANATALVRAHADAVNETGYRSQLVVTTEFADANASIGPATLTFEAAVPADGTPYRLYQNNSGGLSQDYERVTWANDSVRVTNHTTYPPFGNATSRYEMEEARPAPPDVAATSFSEFLRMGEFDLAEAGEDRITLRATGANESAADVNVTSYEGELVVDRRGVLREGSVEVAYVSDGQQIVTTLEYGVRVGDVDVEKPPWVGTAIHEATAITVEATVEGEYVAVTNTGREPIPAGYEVTLMERTENGWGGSPVTLSEPVAPGETVYVSLDAYRTAVDRSPPADPGPLAGTYRVVVRNEDHEVVAEARVEAGD